MEFKKEDSSNIVLTYEDIVIGEGDIYLTATPND